VAFWVAMRIRTVDSARDMELVIDDYVTRGYAVMRGAASALVKKTSLLRTVDEVLLQLDERRDIPPKHDENEAHALAYSCGSCRNQVSTAATFCRYCGAHLRSENGQRALTKM
jgi:hypothetical protein